MQSWNFVNVVGAVDGNHVLMQQPKNSGPRYKNYNGTYSSIILLGKFLFADVGMNGRNSNIGN